MRVVPLISTGEGVQGIDFYSLFVLKKSFVSKQSLKPCLHHVQSGARADGSAAAVGFHGSAGSGNSAVSGVLMAGATVVVLVTGIRELPNTAKVPPQNGEELF